jgi:hypothetical protein
MKKQILLSVAVAAALCSTDVFATRGGGGGSPRRSVPAPQQGPGPVVAPNPSASATKGNLTWLQSQYGSNSAAFAGLATAAYDTAAPLVQASSRTSQAYVDAMVVLG